MKCKNCGYYEKWHPIAIWGKEKAIFLDWKCDQFIPSEEDEIKRIKSLTAKGILEEGFPYKEKGCGKIRIKRVSGRWLSCGEREEKDLPITLCNNCSKVGCGNYLPPVGSYRACGKNGDLCPSCSPNHSQCEGDFRDEEPDKIYGNESTLSKSGSDFILSDYLYTEEPRVYHEIHVKQFIRLRNILDGLLISKKISLREFCIRRDKLSGDLK